MADEIKKQIAKFQAEAEELAELTELQDDIMDAKVTITLGMVTNLIKSLNKKNDEILEVMANTEYYDNGLCKVIEESNKVLANISKQKAPEVKVNVDLTGVISEVAKGNRALIEAINKPAPINDDGLKSAIMQLIAKQNTLIENANKHTDYSKFFEQMARSMDKIANAEKQEQQKVEYTINTVRDQSGRLISTVKTK